MYYFNCETGETSWIRPTLDKAEPDEQPEPSAAPPGTQILVDPSSGCPYWFDPKTGDMNWLPLDYHAPNQREDDMNLELDPSNIATMKKRMTMQHKRRTMKATTDMFGGMDGSAFASGERREASQTKRILFLNDAGLKYISILQLGACTYDESES